MKRLIMLAAFTTALLLPLPASAYDVPVYEEGAPVTIHVDGLYLPSDVMPFIENGRTLVPLRVAAERLGAQVDWNDASKTATITKGSDTIIFIQDTLSYNINGIDYPLDVPLQNKDGRLVVPLRAFGTALGVQVDWIAGIYDVAITTGTAPIDAPSLPYDTPEIARWLVTKFYVHPDAADPHTGSWLYRDDQSMSYHYLFVSKLHSGGYQAIVVDAANPYNNMPPTLLAFNRVAWLQDAALHVAFYGEHFYFYGAGMGWIGGGYDHFVRSADTLTHTQSVMTSTDSNEVYETNDVYRRI